MYGNFNFAIQSKKDQLRIIILIWVLTQFLLFIFLGINPILESKKYISAAEQLIHRGRLPSVRYLFYLSTTLIIAFCLKIKIGFIGVVIIQLLINLIATLYFYSSLQKVESNSYSSLMTTLFLIISIPYQSWNFYLYTESLFYSFSLLFFSSCIRSSKPSTRGLLLQLLLLTITILSRPLGILFLPCWIGYLIFQTHGKMKVFIAGFSLIGVILTIYISNIILGNINDWHVLKPAENGYIICEMPTNARIDLSYLKNNSPIHQLFIYLMTFPKEFLSIAIKRTSAFFLLVRNYYSALHNAYLIFLCFILYLPITLNIKFFLTKRKRSERFVLTSLIIFLFFLAISLQCDDYHNRFHSTIIPVFLYCGVFLFNEKYLTKLWYMNS